MISGPVDPREILSLGYGKNKEENITGWDFELRIEMNMLANLVRDFRCRIVQEPLEMEDEDGWKHLNVLNVHLLARLTRVRLADLHRLRL